MTAGVLCAAILSINMPNAEFACKHMQSLIKYSEQSSVSPTVLTSLIYHESRWIPNAVSHKGACGLTQVLPKYTGDKRIGTKKLTCKQLKNPTTSIETGAITLNYWISTYGRGRYKTGLCGYNVGYNCKGNNKSKRGHAYASRILKMSKKLKNISSTLVHKCFFNVKQNKINCDSKY